MDEMERVFAELKLLGKKLDLVMKFSQLPQAMNYLRAAHELGISESELNLMVKLGLIRTVTYKEGGRPKIPVEEIHRLTTLKPLPVEKARGKPSRKRGSSDGIMSPEELEERIKKL